MDRCEETQKKDSGTPAGDIKKTLPAHEREELDILRRTPTVAGPRERLLLQQARKKAATSMLYEGTAKLDKRTKRLVKRLHEGDIAIIDHEDLDRVTAEALVETGVDVVINASCFTSGKYPNAGPLILCSAGIHLIDNVGASVFDLVQEGTRIAVKGEEVIVGKKAVARGKRLTCKMLEQEMEKAHGRIGEELEKFAVNTLEYMQKEKELILDGSRVPNTKIPFAGRHALIVVRGYDYKADLKTLRSYIREVKPVLIGVDGGADALVEEGYTPHIIIGDMDSVADSTLRCGAELIVHAYAGGRAPGLKRLEQLGLPSIVFESAGTSEDIAMILAYEKGAELIVAVGSHVNLVEFLDKGRKGMSSTFLVRLKVGSKLVDAKGVNKLYRSSIKMSHLVVLLLAGMSAIMAIVMAAPSIRQSIRLVIIQIKLMLGV